MMQRFCVGVFMLLVLAAGDKPDGKVSTPAPHAGLHAYFGVSGTMSGKSSSVALLRSAEQNLEAARMDYRERMVAD